MSSLGFGVKKLGLGKAVRVTANSTNANDDDDDENDDEENGESSQPTNGTSSHHQAIVTTPAAAKRTKPSPPTPIQAAPPSSTASSSSSSSASLSSSSSQSSSSSSFASQFDAIPLSLPLKMETSAPSAGPSSAAPSASPLYGLKLMTSKPLQMGSKISASSSFSSSASSASASHPQLSVKPIHSFAAQHHPHLSAPSGHNSPPNAHTPAPPAVAPTPVAVAAPIPVYHDPPAPTPAPVSSVATVPARSSSISTAQPTLTPAPAPAPSPVIYSDVPVRQPGDSRFLLNSQMYTKLATIGRGGSSLVYKVISSKGIIYALKEINLQTDESAKSNNHVPDYITEVETLHAMHHDPYVIQMQLAQEDKVNKFFYMLMECGSCDLDKHLHTIRSNLSMTSDSPLLPSLIVKYFWSNMLRCVASIHARGIIHTDLKPVNFVFTEQGTLKLIDFGIAKSIAEESTSACFAKPVGTLNYMSPESLPEDGGKIRSSSDIWSLGCILYSWIYGEPPFGRITNHVKKWLAIQDEKETIFFHSTINIIEQLQPTPIEGGKTIKGNGISVSLRDSGCTITRTYPSLPPHLVGVPLPHHSTRTVDPRVIDVLRHCLQRQPAARPTAAQLLKHPYLIDNHAIATPITSSIATSSSSSPSAELSDQVRQLQAEVERLRQQLKESQQQQQQQQHM